MEERHNSHDLLDFMYSISQEMESEYKRIARRAAEDPGTAGDQGEENWAELLKKWLPSTYHVVTKGRILNHEGKASPQVDVVVLKPSYPKKLLSKKMYLAGGVVAAFECKTTLRSHHVQDAVRRAASIRRLLPKRTGNAFVEMHSSIIYGLLAHSHIWKGEGSKPSKNIEKHLLETDKNVSEHPREIIDLVCVADLTVWCGVRSSGAMWEWKDEYAKKAGKKRTPINPQTSYGQVLASQKSGDSVAPVGAFISELLVRLSYEDEKLRGTGKVFHPSSHNRWLLDK